MFRHKSSSSILLQRFEQLFRCPVCYGGQQVQLPPMSTTTTTKTAKSTSTSSKNMWMTGYELDYHIGNDMRTHRSMRTKSLQERISRMRNLSLSFQKEENHDEQQKDISNNNNNNNNHLTRRKFQSELNSLLSALPNTTLVDRYLIVDSANAQHQTNVGTLSSLPEMQKLWQAFQKERICVIFIQENLFENQAPIFNALGAMAEGSANMHDGGKEYQKYLLSSSSSNDKRKEETILPFWRRRGADFRLLSRNSCEENKNDDDDATNTNLPSKNYDVHSLSKKPQQEHPLRPWNSIVIPTVRGFESGDFAAFECLQTLHKMMLEDEAAEIDALMNLFSSSSSSENDDDYDGSEMFPTRKSRGRLSAARIDLVTDDRELIEAAEGGFLSGGRVSQFPHVSKFASGVLTDR